MKILTKEEEDAHYRYTVKWGTIGGLVGLGLGLGSVYVLRRKSPFFRSLTLPFQSFYVTSVGTFAAIIEADRASRSFEIQRHAEVSEYIDETARLLALARENRTQKEKIFDWLREHRYPIVTASWLASMGVSLGLVSRNKYLTKTQKLVQARVYAQGLTLLVLVATAAFEVSDAKSGKGRWETIRVRDENTGEMVERKVELHKEQYEGEDLWKDMMAAEERRLKRQKEERARRQQSQA